MKNIACICMYIELSKFHRAITLLIVLFDIHFSGVIGWHMRQKSLTLTILMKYTATVLDAFFDLGFIVGDTFMFVCFREEILLQILKLKLQYDDYVLTNLRKAGEHFCI